MEVSTFTNKIQSFDMTTALNSSLKNKTTREKAKELLKISRKLVLCQVHELERIVKDTYTSSEYKRYVEYLYNHYIINNGEKTYNYDRNRLFDNSKKC